VQVGSGTPTSAVLHRALHGRSQTRPDVHGGRVSQDDRGLRAADRRVPRHTLHGNLALLQQLELFAAGSLAGRAKPMIAAYRKCTFTSPTVPRTIGLLEQFHALLLGEPRSTTAALRADIEKKAKARRKMPELFSAAATKAASFDTLLVDHLQRVWRPEVAQADFRAIGRWCLHAAVLCQIAGRVPVVSAKTALLLPAELARARASRSPRPRRSR
jgi:hypothetical protein